VGGAGARAGPPPPTPTPPTPQSPIPNPQIEKIKINDKNNKIIIFKLINKKNKINEELLNDNCIIK